jgi:hypothetical protein
MKAKYNYYYNKFQLTLPVEAVYEMSAAGDQTETVEFWSKRIPNNINPEFIRKELKETGAWDEIELKDDEKNWRRILWITACNIEESDEFKLDEEKDENE